MQKDQLSVLGFVVSQIYELSAKVRSQARLAIIATQLFPYPPTVIRPTIRKNPHHILILPNNRLVTASSSRIVTLALIRSHHSDATYQVNGFLTTFTTENETVC